MNVLVLNCGSSSVRFPVIDTWVNGEREVPGSVLHESAGTASHSCANSDSREAVPGSVLSPA